MDEKETYFTPDRKKDGMKEVFSEDGLYKIQIFGYGMGEGYWDFTQGIVSEVKTGKIIADVKRNYSDFWYRFIVHPNGNEYLLCGEDYQGYTVINCNTGKRYDYLPPEAAKGWGFCWTAAEPIDDGNKIEVYGCFWGAPFEYVIYDFSNPESLPYPELSRRTDDYDYEEDDEEGIENGHSG
jgi:hypothetical protein